MKKQLVGLWPLLLLVPLSGNTGEDARLSFFQIPLFKDSPILESHYPLSRSLDIQVKSNCYLRVTMLLMNANLKGVLINPTNDSEVKYTEGYVLVGTSAYARSYKAGETLTVRWSYPADKLLDFNSVNLTVESRYSAEDNYPRNVVMRFPAVVDHPSSFTLNGEGSSEKTLYAGCYLRYPERTGMERWATEYKGFPSEIQNPYQNALPLDQARIRSRDYDGQGARFGYKKAYLRLHDDDGSIPLGNEGGDAREKWRDFLLRLGEEDAEHYASFALYQSLAISPDGRYLKKGSAKGERDLWTHKLFLPPVKNKESKTYSFSLYIEGAGEAGQDNFRWDFSVYKDKNYFGCYPNSDYAVEVS
jgi:hypothetical protein